VDIIEECRHGLVLDSGCAEIGTDGRDDAACTDIVCVASDEFLDLVEYDLENGLGGLANDRADCLD